MAFDPPYSADDIAKKKFIQKELCGSLFRNDRKEKETHPDYKGTAKVGNVEYFVSGWIKDKKDGTGKWLSLAFTAKDANLGDGNAF